MHPSRHPWIVAFYYLSENQCSLFFSSGPGRWWLHDVWHTPGRVLGGSPRALYEGLVGWVFTRGVLARLAPPGAAIGGVFQHVMVYRADARSVLRRADVAGFTHHGGVAAPGHVAPQARIPCPVKVVLACPHAVILQVRESTCDVHTVRWRHRAWEAERIALGRCRACRSEHPDRARRLRAVLLTGHASNTVK